MCTHWKYHQLEEMMGNQNNDMKPGKGEATSCPRQSWPISQDWMFSKDSLPHFVGLTKKPTNKDPLSCDSLKK